MVHHRSLSTSQCSRHPWEKRLVAALLRTGVRLSARWGPQKATGLEAIGCRWAGEGLNEKAWSALREEESATRAGA